MSVSSVAIRGQRSLASGRFARRWAGGGPAQARLDMVTRIIALSMVAEVCSLYLRRANGEIELFATEGLAPSAVHVTRLKPDEGLVGEIMRMGRPLNLAEAPAHPASPSPTGPRRARTPTTRLWGCRCCAAGAPLACWPSRTARCGPTPEEEVEDLQINRHGPGPRWWPPAKLAKSSKASR